MKWRKACWTLKILPAGKNHTTFHTKGGTQSVRAGAQRTEPRVTENNSKTFKCNGVCSAGFLNCLGPVTSFVLPFFPFWMGVPIAVILCLYHHCILGADELFSSFTGIKMKRNFALGWTVPRASPIPNLDDLDAKVWDFSTEEIKMRFWTLSWYHNGLKLWGEFRMV